MPKIVMSDSVFPDQAVENEVLEALGTEIVLAKSNAAEDIIAAAKDADALLVVFAEITKEVIDQLDNCKIISRAGVGINNIDIQAAKEKGIKVSYVPDYCIDEVSDHTLALALALNRKIRIYDEQVHNGGWAIDGSNPIYSMNGQTWGLVGFGKIAQVVARKAQAFGFNVIAYDPFVSAATAEEFNVKVVELEEVIKEADVLSVHAPLNEHTKHIINETALRNMKNTAYLINTSRGGLVDSEALAKAIQEKWIAGAGTDVLEEEPPSSSDPLVGLGKNMLITPHMAFYSEEAKITLRKSATMEIVSVLTGKELKNPAY